MIENQQSRRDIWLGLSDISEEVRVLTFVSCISTQINREDLDKLGQALNHPLSSVFVTLTGVSIFTAQEGAPHAAADAVIVRGCGQRYLLTSGTSHD